MIVSAFLWWLVAVAIEKRPSVMGCGASGPRVEGSVFDFTAADAKGAAYPLAQHRGRCLLIVNVASQ